MQPTRTLHGEITENGIEVRAQKEEVVEKTVPNSDVTSELEAAKFIFNFNVALQRMKYNVGVYMDLLGETTDFGLEEDNAELMLAAIQECLACFPAYASVAMKVL